jgi:hypothetical protein
MKMQVNKDQIINKVKELGNKRLTEEAQSHLYLDNNSKGVLDAVQEKVISRKLLVFLTATAMFVYAGLDPDTWGMIAMCYIGGQAAIDFAKIWKG